VRGRRATSPPPGPARSRRAPRPRLPERRRRSHRISPAATRPSPGSAAWADSRDEGVSGHPRRDNRAAMRILVTEPLSERGLALLRKDFQVDVREELAAGGLADAAAPYAALAGRS